MFDEKKFFLLHRHKIANNRISDFKIDVDVDENRKCSSYRIEKISTIQ
jgi:hypothetical protein